MSDPGESPRPLPSLFLDEPEARTAKKNFFGDRSPPPPPYIKVWTLHWTVMILALEALVKNFKELNLFGCTQQANYQNGICQQQILT